MNNSLFFNKSKPHLIINHTYVWCTDVSKHLLLSKPIKQNSLFTTRELQCIPYLFAGLSAKEIAKKLLIAPKTVYRHIENIKLKLNCKKTIGILQAVVKLGLVDMNTLVRYKG